MKRLLVANRGEIAIRILRSARERGLETCTVYTSDEGHAAHVDFANEAIELTQAGPQGFLDIEQLIEVARTTDCDALHPGYGFASEDPELAEACRKAGIVFVGPSPQTLEQLGDKLAARTIADRLEIPPIPGAPTRSAKEAEAFLAELPAGSAVVIKAVAGGGGRGMRRVEDPRTVETTWERCRSESTSAFGRGDVYVERYLEGMRHIEVQIAGDLREAVSLGTRDCSVQRRHQKVLEIAPALGLAPDLVARLEHWACELASELGYQNLGTVEFLVDGSRNPGDEAFFLEVNPRLQVEHTVTEEATGLDLVGLQLALADGQSLEQCGLRPGSSPPVIATALQLRINAERYEQSGEVRPTGGRIDGLRFPTGPGIRIDTYARQGVSTSPAFDSLLAKLVVSLEGDGRVDPEVWSRLLERARGALEETEIEGLLTNLPVLASILREADVATLRFHTRWLEERLPDLPLGSEPIGHAIRNPGSAGAAVDPRDPLAVLAFGKGAIAGALPATSTRSAPSSNAEAGPDIVPAPLQGTIVSLEVGLEDSVQEGQAILVLESMKMEHLVAAPHAGIVREFLVAPGDTIYEGHPLARVEPADVVDTLSTADDGGEDPGFIRPDLADALARQAKRLDAERPEAVARRRKTGQRTARENVEDLCDPDSFFEYGSLVIAARRRRQPLQELIDRTPADGLITGVGTVNGNLFGNEKARCAVLSYDYTVLAGTQGKKNHDKKDRLFELAERERLPVVFFTEGGGGRPGDTDVIGVAGLDCMAFHIFGRLSGLVPLVGINSGRCFAGNAALLGCCDVVIATLNSNIGMGGPAMIEGGGLGVFRPEDIGPIDVQADNGVVDIVARDEAEAVAFAKQYLSYFQGSVSEWTARDQRLLRHVIPENRLRIYEVRRVVEGLADEGSVLELRQRFGKGMVTALARIESRPIGIVANDPAHLAGAITSDGADKAARFLQLCDAHDLPVLFLCDTPGIMVGPEAEKTALVRHAARMFVVGASITVPFFTVVLRKSYGLGAQAMGGGSFKAPFFTVSWPTGEFGGMGLEGAVKLGFRKELEAIEDPEERRVAYERMVAEAYERGSAINTASHFEIDDVIDPAETRSLLARALRATPPPAPRAGKKRPAVDTW